MQLNLNAQHDHGYKSPSRRGGKMSEQWAADNLFCPVCGGQDFEMYGNNHPFADLRCRLCDTDYEVKSATRRYGKKFRAAAYDSMQQKVMSGTNPHVIFIHYNKDTLAVQNVFIIPKQFFKEEVLEKCKPLSLTARRAGWVGCNLLLHLIPETSRIYLVQSGMEQDTRKALKAWQKIVHD